MKYLTRIAGVVMLVTALCLISGVGVAAGQVDELANPGQEEPLAASAAIPHVAPYSTHPSGTRPYATCPPATGMRVTCLSAVVPTEDGEPVVGPAQGSGEKGGLSPTDLRGAYGLSQTGGKGSKIAIVVAYDNPNAKSDWETYRNTYELPPCNFTTECTFTKYNQKGEQTNYPEPEPGWAVESSLDVDMAAAICPQCSIMLVEADSDSFADMAAAEDRAAQLGATVISNSWGALESQFSTPYASHFNHNLPIVAASGDYGFGVSFPASHPNVISVGGTRLEKASSTRGWSETAWAGSGSGCSEYFSKPAWQTDSGCATRSVADVSAVAAPETGVSVYDSYKEAGWMVVGGTSASSPIIAALEARSSSAERAEKAARFWKLGSEGKLFDVTEERNGSCDPNARYLCDARVGYDGVTGWGTPGGSRPAPPSVGTYDATALGTKRATLNGAVNPNGKETTYSFEYGPTTSYGSSIPASPASAGSGTSAVQVSRELTGLQRDMTYHFRLVATNSLGTAYGADEEFTTTRWVHDYVPYSPNKPGLEPMDVSCASTTMCMALGETIEPISAIEVRSVSAVRIWNGSTWESEDLSGAEDTLGNVQVMPSDVSCASTSSCVTVGSMAGSEGYLPYAARWNGVGWTAEGMPAPSDLATQSDGSHLARILGIDCISPSWCMAVGWYYADGVGGQDIFKSLTEIWNGSTWIVQSAPSPSMPTGGRLELEAVSCVSSSECTTVGRRYGFSGKLLNFKTLTETWDGTSWTIQPSPDAAGVDNMLKSISCDGPDSCMTVGFTEEKEDDEKTLKGYWLTDRPLALRWNGSTWDSAPPNRPLSDVSCVTGDWCMAVGEPYNNGRNPEELMAGAELWNGSDWSPVAIAKPADLYRGPRHVTPYGANCDSSECSALEGVACLPSTCVGVGWYTGIAAYPPLAEHFSVDSPQATTLPATGTRTTRPMLRGTVNPEGLATSYQFEYGDSTEYGSSVPASPAAAGSGTTDVAVEQPLTGLESNTTYHFRLVASNAKGSVEGDDQTFTTGEWSIQEVEEPTGTSSARLTATVCPAAGECIAVGSYNSSSGARFALVDAGPLGDPLSARTDVTPAGALESTLADLSCTGPTECIAVGSYKDSSGAVRTLVAHFDGTDWTILNTPNPANAVESRLEGVSCTTASSCVAVGHYKPAAGLPLTLAERYGGGSWSLSSTPNPSTPQAYLRDVSCANASDCWAVGEGTYSLSEQMAGKKPAGLAEHFDGSTWSIKSLPETAPPLSALSCPTTGACIAVGGETTERYDGSGWTQGSLLAAAADIDCRSPSACTAVGSFIKEGNHSTPISQHWDGSSWSSAEMVDAVGTIDGANAAVASGVSCVSGSACTAVGYYKAKSLEERALMELRGPGALPSVVTQPATGVGSTASTLNATVNPNGEDTAYRFEYGKTTTYGTSVPIAAKGIGSGSKAIAVSELVTGLSNETTYHFRIVAEGAAGTAQGADVTFETHSPRFEADQYPATVSAAQTTPHVFSAAGGTATCPVASFTADASKASGELTVSPTYAGGECTAFGYTQSSVSMNGCTYNAHVSQQIEVDHYKGPIDLKCPSGKEVEINAGPCTVKIPPQSNLNSVEFENKPATSPSSVSIKANVTGIRGTLTKKSFLCFFTAGEFTNGSYSGSVLATAKNGAGSPIGVRVTGS